MHTLFVDELNWKISPLIRLSLVIKQLVWDGAEGGSNPTSYLTRPSYVRVCQFHHA